jgi:hypothetical protein
MNLSRNHFFLSGNVDQDLLSRFPKGIRVWLGGMRDLKDMWSSTMEERESEEHELLFRARVSLGEEGAAYKGPQKSDRYSEICHSRVAPAWPGVALDSAPEQSGSLTASLLCPEYVPELLQPGLEQL